MKELLHLIFDNSGAVGGVQDVTLIDGKAVMAIAGENAYYTKAIKIAQGMYYGLHLKALSASSTPTIKIELEQSSVLPTTEGSADGTYVVPDGVSAIYSNLNDEIWHVKSFTPVPMTYCRFKLTGLTGNPADATLQLKLFVQAIIN